MDLRLQLRIGIAPQLDEPAVVAERVFPLAAPLVELRGAQVAQGFQLRRAVKRPVDAERFQLIAAILDQAGQGEAVEIAVGYPVAGGS